MHPVQGTRGAPVRLTSGSLLTWVNCPVSWSTRPVDQSTRAAGPIASGIRGHAPPHQRGMRGRICSGRRRLKMARGAAAGGCGGHQRAAHARARLKGRTGAAGLPVGGDGVAVRGGSRGGGRSWGWARPTGARAQARAAKTRKAVTRREQGLAGAEGRRGQARTAQGAVGRPCTARRWRGTARARWRVAVRRGARGVVLQSGPKPWGPACRLGARACQMHALLALRACTGRARRNARACYRAWVRLAINRPRLGATGSLVDMLV